MIPDDDLSSVLRQSQSILKRCRTIAILGARDQPHQAGFYVPKYSVEQGYTVFPVNPGRVGQSLFGQPVVARLTDLRVPVDMVDVFRRSEALPDHLSEFLSMNPQPKVVWFQQGIRHAQVAAELRQAGIEVIEDRCTLADHRRLGLGRIG